MQDDPGFYLGSSALVPPRLSDPMTWEALSPLKTLALAEDLMIQRLRIASLHISHHRIYAHLDLLTPSSRRSTKREACSIVHVGCSTNMEVHHLVKHALNLAGVTTCGS